MKTLANIMELKSHPNWSLTLYQTCSTYYNKDDYAP